MCVCVCVCVCVCDKQKGVSVAKTMITQNKHFILQNSKFGAI